MAVHAIRPEVRDDVVAFCEVLLERAKSGEVRGIVVLAACEGGSIASAYERGEGSVRDFVFALENAKLMLMGVPMSSTEDSGWVD